MAAIPILAGNSKQATTSAGMMNSFENGESNMPMNSIGIEMKNSFQGTPSNSECKPSIFINGFSINNTFIKDSSNAANMGRAAKQRRSKHT